MKHKLIIDGNAVYELDLKCLAKKTEQREKQKSTEKNQERKK